MLYLKIQVYLVNIVIVVFIRHGYLLVSVQGDKLMESDSIRLIVDTLKISVPEQSKVFHFDYKEWILAVIAFLAVFAGPLIQSIIARKSRKQIDIQIELSKRSFAAQIGISRSQLNVSVLSKNRQDWINTLRDSISEYVSIITNWAINGSIEEKNKNNNIINERLLFLKSKIELLINPKEDDHTKLVNLLDQILKNIIHCVDGHESDIDNLLREITNVSQTILKREWERVKNIN